MKQSEAKRLILEAWDEWARKHVPRSSVATGRDSLKFFIELQDSKSPLLQFQTRGRDQWQIVHSWLESEARVRP
jgi:hypothetical protein